MKLSIRDFFSKCDQIRRNLRIWSHLLKKSSMETSFFVQWWTFVDFLSRRVYKGWVYHVGATIAIVSTFFQRTLFITRPIKMKGGNAKANILFQSCCIAPAAKLFGSGFHATYWGIWWRSLEANYLLLGFLRVWLFSEKLSDEVSNRIKLLTFLNSQSALTFYQLKRYSTVIAIWWGSR